MIMKNLTHYFKSPKEDEKDQKVEKTDSPTEVVEERAPSKKRKISLSKSKKKKCHSQEDELLSLEQSHVVCEAQSKTEKPSSEKLTIKKNKKRKIEDDSNSSCKKVKTTRSSKISFKKCEKNNVNADVHIEIEKSESNTKMDRTNIPKIEEEETFITLENSPSCDEPLVRTNRRVKKYLFEDSDDETQRIELQSSSSSGKVENNENSCNITSRNSLFSYFNKVDKKTALKQQNIGRIEVKAIVHSSENGIKIDRKSLDKVNIPNKPKNHKNKLRLESSDSIEVISSEEIMDENSSTTFNVPMEAEQNNKSSSCPNADSVENKSKPSNMASIFMPKKISRQTLTIENISFLQSEKQILVKENENERVQCGKETSRQRKALSKRKNCSKTKEKKSLRKEKCLSNKESVDHVIEDNICSGSIPSGEKEKELLSLDKSSTLKLNGSVTTSSNTRKDFARKLNFPNNQNPKSEKTSPTGDSPIVKSTKNLKNSNRQTPEKSNFLALKNKNDEEITPKKKGLTINGYFTPQNTSLNSNSTGNPQKSETKSVKSPWVMKVCLNSSSKHLKVDSEEDDYKEDLPDLVNEGKYQIYSNSQGESVEKSEANPPVVVIEDNDSSTDGNKDNDDGKRKSLPRNAKKAKQKCLEEEEIIEVEPQISKVAVKMWPFFQKGGVRQTKEAPVDQAKLKAKMLFLESGVPEIIKRKVETVKSDAVLGSPAPFPTVSHIVQADETNCGGSASLPLPPNRSVSPTPSVPTWTSMLPMDLPKEPDIPVFKRPGNVKTVLEKLKEEEPKTEVKVLYKKLKEYKNKAESDLWTEVYKPTNSADMVGNSENIKKLKTWLETLKNCRKREGSVSSGDEFINEDSDGDDNSFNNMAVICGPYGCGKTSAVYAIAKELDIKVLEINASCNRSGKRISAEFSESTQSHHVERSQPINGFFSNQNLVRKKKKKSKNADQSKSEKTSLILVEDADLLFTDCDEGFVPALASLAATSKRPIVLVTNQVDVPHLDRFNNSKLLRLKFSRPRPNKLGLWLRLVGLVEGVVMSSDLALHLVTVSNCDIRRCLMQLQLMIHSNNSEVKDKLSPSRLWWGWPSQHQLSYELPTLLEPEDEEPRPEVDKKLVLSQLQTLADTTRRLANLDMLSLNSRMECLEDHKDPCPVAWAARWRDSTALTVPSTLDFDLCSEASWLQQALTNNLGSSHRTGLTPQEAKWLSILRQGEQCYMCGIATTAHTSHQSVTCDYLPTLRELGRSEQVRLANYTRRANRFFNYLQGLGIHASKLCRDFMSDAFS